MFSNLYCLWVLVVIISRNDVLAQSTTITTTTTATTTPTTNTSNVTTPGNRTTTTTMKPTTSFETKCSRYSSWNPDFYLQSMSCLTKTCVQDNTAIFDLYLQCNSRKNKEETQTIAFRMTQYILERANEISMLANTAIALRLQGSVTETNTGEHFATVYGVINRNFTTSHKLVDISFSKPGIEEIIQFPPNVLESVVVAYQCSVFNDIYNPTDNFLYLKEQTSIRKALDKLPPSVTNPASKDGVVGYQINSNIIYFSFSPDKEKFEDYVLFKFKFRDSKGTTNHRCVRFHHGTHEFWSDDGCYVHQKEEHFIYCRCDTIVGRYAIISDLAIKPDPPAKLARDSISMALYAISGFGIAAAFASLLLPKLFKCQHLGGMLKIYRAADMTFIVYCGFVLFSVMQSEETGTAKIIAAVLHFLHHASAIWFIVEGVHLYHEMTPLYSGAIGMMFFYSTLAFGTSAALAGAATGYDYTFSGKTQFLWAYAPGIDAVFMFIPTLSIILMQIAFDILLIWELMSWIGSQYDYLYTRSVTFIKRCTGYIFVYAITHGMGVMAMSNQESSVYAWLFIGFYGIETICLFYHHCASNVECWEWKELEDFKRELAETEDTDSEFTDEEESDAEPDEDSNDGVKRKVNPIGRFPEKNPETIINMEDHEKVFYEEDSSKLTRTKSEFSVSSHSKLIRSDSSCSVNEEAPALQQTTSNTSIRESPRIEEGSGSEVDHPGAPELEDEEVPQESGGRPDLPLPEQDRPSSQASIASTISNRSTVDSDTEEKAKEDEDEKVEGKESVENLPENEAPQNEAENEEQAA